MTKPNRSFCIAMIAALAIGRASAQAPASAPAAPAGKAESHPPIFEYQEVMIPMRDGVRLQTVILRHVGNSSPLPILLERTPYGVEPKSPETMPAGIKELASDGYIFVTQNLRGRFKSEGMFSLADDWLTQPGKGTIETRDAWDTIDWLIKNVPLNNGRVGMKGVSYMGYTAGVTLLDPHPALKAISEQASPVDLWVNDDDHRNGALRLSYAFEYAVMEEQDKNENAHFSFETWDTYQWYLELGSLSNIDDRYLHGKISYWNDIVAHPDYDEFWKARNWIRDLHSSTVPNLNVAGFWDQEDPWGPWEVFRNASKSDPERTNLIVAGPWCHGCWLRAYP
jgi:uncharacterized protein